MAVTVVTQDTFEAEVMGAGTPVVIDFWATWCGPCRMFAPDYEEVAEELDGQAKFVKIDIDESMELARKFKVMSIPTLVIVKDGKPAAKNVGVLSKKELADWVKENI